MTDITIGSSSLLGFCYFSKKMGRIYRQDQWFIGAGY